MAIWQYDLMLVPRGALDAGLAEVLSAEQLEACVWASQPPGDWRERLTRILPQASSWDAALELWGEENGNRIEVLLADGRVREVSARISAREERRDFIEQLAELAREWNCLFVSVRREPFEPDAEALLLEVKRSPAYRYALDPRGHLEAIARDRDPDVPRPPGRSG